MSKAKPFPPPTIPGWLEFERETRGYWQHLMIADELALLFDQMGRGKRLRVPFNGTPATFDGVEPVHAEHVAKIISGQKFPARGPAGGYVLYWAKLLRSDNHADWYCLAY